MYDVFWEDEDGSLTFQYYENKVFAHAKVHVWNKRVYLKCINTWYVAIEELRERGYTEVFVLIPSDDKKLIKFETMFGFTPIKEHEGVLLMACSTEK
jgi:hypothetical protein